MPEETRERQVIPHYRDPIRIVSLHTPDELLKPLPHAPAAPPHLTYRGGPLIANAKMFTIFWGSAWHGAQAGLATQINNFYDFILTSALIDQLAEYNTPQFKIGHGKRVGTLTLTTPAPAKTTSDTAIRHMLQTQIAHGGGSFPAPDANTLYFVYLPPGVSVTQGGSKSCQAFCGYHDTMSSQVFYGVLPYPNCNGCTGGMSVEDALTTTSSHEMCEAITDAVPGTGWYDDNNGEIGDICAWKTKKVGQWTVQLEWSNQHNNCV